jgi:hypothetical protein
MGLSITSSASKGGVTRESLTGATQLMPPRRYPQLTLKRIGNFWHRGGPTPSFETPTASRRTSLYRSKPQEQPHLRSTTLLAVLNTAQQSSKRLLPLLKTRPSSQHNTNNADNISAPHNNQALE